MRVAVIVDRRVDTIRRQQLIETRQVRTWYIDMRDRCRGQVLERFNIICRTARDCLPLGRLRCRSCFRQEATTMDDALCGNDSLTMTILDCLLDALQRMFTKQLQYLNKLTSSR